MATLPGIAAASAAITKRIILRRQWKYPDLTRKGSSGVQMDNLNYTYNRDGSGKLQNNRLASLNDVVLGVAHTGELEGTSNYGYDAIGNGQISNDIGLLNLLL